MNKVVQMKGRTAAARTPDLSTPEDAGADHGRIPWSGNLDESEIGKPGGLLLAALIRRANELRHQMNDMARELGVTYGYINQLRNGRRATSNVSDEFAMRCAQYLSVPRMTVLMLAGRVTPQDLFEHEKMMAAEIARAMAFIVEDPKWGPLVTAELRKSSLESQFLLVRLYEEATDKRLMDSHLRPETLSQDIARLAAVQAERAQQLAALASQGSAEQTQEG